MKRRNITNKILNLSCDDGDGVMVALRCSLALYFIYIIFAYAVASVFFYIVRYAGSYRDSVGGK